MFQFHLPIKIIFGAGAVKSAGKEAILYGKKAVIVTGRSSLKQTGLLSRLEEILSAENIRAAVFDEVSPEPGTDIVDRGVAFASRNGCDLVIGAGGGSALDAAKAIAALKNTLKGDYTSDYLDVDGTKNITVPGIPFIALPTAAGTGAETTMNAVLINSRTGNKRSLRSPHLFPKAALIDPELTLSVPPDTTAIAGIDCLIHLLEGYISKASNTLSDMYAAAGMPLLTEALPSAVKNGSDLEARSGVCLASLYGGIVIANGGLGLVHGMGSVIGAKYNIPHGLSCALLFPAIIEYNMPAIPPEKRKTITGLFGKDPAAWIKDYLALIGLSKTLARIKLPETDLPAIAEKTLTTSSGKKNPRSFGQEDLLAILGNIR